MTIIYRPPPTLEEPILKLLELLAHAQKCKVVLRVESSDGAEYSETTFDRREKKK